ncbi:MAG: DUF5071 domain-containing protein [Gammaproteobacteria bacterium]|nr:DUF5071 domain-containing protein [Gammaproteobacteria bacterium]
MDEKALKALLPRNKDDVEHATTLVNLGHPAVAPVLPQMLGWLKTTGSPVELIMRDFFVALGAHAVPVVRNALRSRNDTWKYGIVNHIVTQWPAEAIAPLVGELQGIAASWTASGTDIIALQLLVQHRLGDREWLEQWSQFKVKRLRELLANAEEVNRMLAQLP